MQLCFDATRFGFGLKEAIELASLKKVPAVEFTFEPFATTGKATALSEQEKQFLEDVARLCADREVAVSLIKLNVLLDVSKPKTHKSFRQMISRLAKVAGHLCCKKIAFHLKPCSDESFLLSAEGALQPVLEDLAQLDMKLLLSLSTPSASQGLSLKKWRPLEPQEIRDLLAGCPGLCLSFSAADFAWQNIDYLQILPGLMAAIAHVEARDVEINRPLLADSGIFGPLWWRYRRPGKGQIDWRQLIEALKLYDFQGGFSIHLDDEFGGETQSDLEDSLGAAMSLLTPLLR